jgi:hypothetical protein
VGVRRCAAIQDHWHQPSGGHAASGNGGHRGLRSVYTYFPSRFVCGLSTYGAHGDSARQRLLPLSAGADGCIISEISAPAGAAVPWLPATSHRGPCGRFVAWDSPWLAAVPESYAGTHQTPLGLYHSDMIRFKGRSRSCNAGEVESRGAVVVTPPKREYTRVYSGAYPKRVDVMEPLDPETATK